MSFASQFQAGSDIMGDLIDTYKTAKKRGRMQEIAQAKQQESGGNLIEGTPEAVQTELSRGPDKDSGAGMGEARKLASTGTAPMQYSFLGKTQATPFDESAMGNARMQAMAGVMDEEGDQEGAMRYRQQAQQGVMQAMQLKQAERQGKREDKSDAETAAVEAIDKKIGEQSLAKRTIDGVVRPAVIGDHLNDLAARAAAFADAGLSQHANTALGTHAALALQDIHAKSAQRDEDTGRAALGMASGDFEPLKQYYNKHVPDGARVTGITAGKDGNLIVDRVSLDGKPLPQEIRPIGQISAALKSFKDPTALYHWSQDQFKNNIELRKVANDERETSLKNRGGGPGRTAAVAQDGVDAKPIDAYFMKHLGGVDELGQPKPVNPAVLSVLRQAAFSLPTATNDPNGAAISIHAAWQRALTAQGVAGNEQKALQVFRQVMQPAANPPSDQPAAPKAEGKAATEKPATTATMKQVAAGPKEGDTRTVGAGRGKGTKTQVYKRIGRSGAMLSWVDQ